MNKLFHPKDVNAYVVNKPLLMLWVKLFGKKHVAVDMSSGEITQLTSYTYKNVIYITDHKLLYKQD